jgi:hypothetical protein
MPVQRPVIISIPHPHNIIHLITLKLLAQYTGIGRLSIRTRGQFCQFGQERGCGTLSRSEYCRTDANQSGALFDSDFKIA